MKIAIVGAGGLGGPIALALARPTFELVIFDHDVVELSNLHRQIQFTDDDLGKPKAECLARAVSARGGRARGHVRRWDHEPCELIVDASDDPVTKFAVADWAMATGRCYVIAAALRYGGNVMIGAPGAACYRCLFEEPSEAATCADAGVLGPVVGAIGGVAAAAALALARGDRALAGALLVFDDLRRDSEPRIVRFAPRPGCACDRVTLLAEAR